MKIQLLEESRLLLEDYLGNNLSSSLKSILYPLTVLNLTKTVLDSTFIKSDERIKCKRMKRSFRPVTGIVQCLSNIVKTKSKEIVAQFEAVNSAARL